LCDFEVGVWSWVLAWDFEVVLAWDFGVVFWRWILAWDFSVGILA